jgi:uncharacterized protein YcbK (DUF882 family)
MLLAILPLQVFMAASLQTATPVEVTLFDANHKETYVVHIALDGSIDDETRDTLEHAFRCRRSDKEHAIDPGLLAMIAQLQHHYPGKALEYISAYRGHSGQRHTSRHFMGRAFDFRIQGVSLIEARDWIWENFQDVGLGWYPEYDFLHMDHRDGHPDTAWTARHHRNRYHPSWSTRVREQHELRTRQTRTGI